MRRLRQDWEYARRRGGKQNVQVHSRASGHSIGADGCRNSVCYGGGEPQLWSGLGDSGPGEQRRPCEFNRCQHTSDIERDRCASQRHG